MEQKISIEYLSRKDTVLASILNDIYDAVYIVDRQRRILFWNKGAEEITGYSVNDVQGRWCGDNILNHIDEDGNLLCQSACPLVRAISTGERQQQKVYPLHKRGHRFPVVTHVAPIRDERGEVIAAVEVFRDISKEEEFRILQEKFNKLIRRYVSSATLNEVTAQLHGGADSGTSVRDLTILYLDVVGFTPFSEHHGADESVALLNEVFGICDVITTEFQGDVDKFIGDCVMAVFIDANDAVGAAKQILAALERLNSLRLGEAREPVEVRIGINSGRVVQGEVGMQDRKDLTVIGDVVNTAARIQHLARPNSICVSEATLARLKDTAAFKFEQQVAVKGKSQPVNIYRYSGEDEYR